MDLRWTVAAWLMLLPGLVAAGLLWIQFQNFRTRGWRQATGRIVESRSEAREVRKVEHHTGVGPSTTHFVDEEKVETKNVARIRYEFSVDGATHSSTRVEMGADNAESDVVATLRKYPAGRLVQVYFNPRDPSQSLLEHADGKMIRMGWFAVLVLIALIFGGVFGIDLLASYLEAHIARPQYTPLVVALLGFALALAAFAHMIGKKKREMAAWPCAPGEIVRSEVTTTLRRDTASGSGRDQLDTMYLPRVVFRYPVSGILFEGDNIGSIVTANAPGPAEAQIRKFPLQMKVDVFYNPANPSESTLDRSIGYARVVLWVLSAAFLAGAAALAGSPPFH